MTFFTDYQKDLAHCNSAKCLRKAYKKSERDLKKVARCGDEQNLVKVMKQHGDIEYAMLFQKTPEFKKGVRK